MNICTLRHILLISAAAAVMTAGRSADARSLEFPWLRIPSGPASLAMAGAGTLSDDNLAWAASGSSAMAALSDKTFAASAAYSGWNPSPLGRFNAGASVKPGAGLSISGGVSYITAGSYAVYDGGGQETGTFSPSMLSTGLGLGMRLSAVISLGANLHYSRESAGEDAGYSALSGDVMLALRRNAFRADVGLYSIGKVTDGGRLKDFPASVRATAGYDSAISGGRFPIAVYGDADCYLGGAVSAAAGVSAGFKGIVSLRCGYRYSSKTAPLPSFGTVGAGVELCGIGLDIAYVLSSDAVDGSFQAGLRYSF